MPLSSIVLSLLLLPLPFNSPQDATLAQRYEAAQELARAGRLSEAETELKTILAEEYGRLTKIHAALANRERALEAAEAAANYRSKDNQLLIELAMSYLEAAQFDKALDPLLRAARLQPNNADVQRALGKTYFALGDYEKSARALEEAVRLAPNDFNSSYTLAIAYLQQRQFPSAKRVFDRMITQFGEKPQIYVAIGRAFREAGRLPEAVEAFKKAVALDSKFPGAHYNLGLAYLLNEGAAAVANAEEEFKIELVANPGDFFSNYYLGITCIFQRKWAPAIDFLRTASRIQPNNPDPYFQLGQAYQETKEHQQAIEVLKKAIDLNPNLAHNKFQVTTAHYRLAQSLLQTGQTEAGRKELQVASDLKARAFETAQSLSSGQATMGASRVPDENDQTSRTSSLPAATATRDSLDPKTRSVLEANETQLTKIISALHNTLGLVQAGQQNFAGAASEFRLAKTLNPQQAGLDYNLGLAYFRAQSYREALAPLESETKSNPTNVQARWLLGLSYFNTRDYSKAAELLQDVPSSGSTNVELCYALASSLIRQGKIALAEQAIERMSMLSDAAPRLHLLRGQLHYANGNTENAKEELTTALALDGQAREAHYFLGLVYSQKQMFADAAKEFEAELSGNPNNVEAQFRLAQNLLARGTMVRGIQMLQDVIKIEPNFSQARYELGKALLQQADVAGAVSNLEIAVKLEPENALFHYELGHAYIAAGRREEAKRANDTFNRLKKQTKPDQVPQ
jgi:tetratricopeptide (TPR) repeat protein